VTRFEGFGAQVQKWFRGLQADNSRAYFAARRDFFEESIRDQIPVTELSETFGGEVTMFRQNRDIGVQCPRICRAGQRLELSCCATSTTAVRW
jgi:uncharacterized protein (DUF2461 family)